MMITQTKICSSGGLKIIGFYSDPLLKKPFPSSKFDYGNVLVQKLPNITYPGRGIAKTECSEFFPFSCECGKTKQMIHHSCGRITCPICYQNTINKQAMKTTKRLVLIRKNLQDQFDFTCNYSHISFNTLYEIETYSQFNKAKNELYKILRKEGLSGLLIFHPWRKKKSLVPWKTNPKRFKIGFKTKKLNEFPHFHFIGIGKPRNSDLFLEKYGFTYHKIRNLRSQKAIFSTIRYLLSHTGKFVGKHTINWFNQFSYNSFKTEKNVDKEVIICGSCKSPLYKVITPIEKIKGNFISGFRFYIPVDYELDYECVLRKKKEWITIEYRKSFAQFMVCLKV